MADTLYTRIVLRNGATADWETAKSQVLLKGEAGVEFLADGKVKIKIGDGTTIWENLPYVGSEEAKVFQVNSLDEITETNLAIGDIAIVKTAIYTDENNAGNNKYSYTSYVYNKDGNWAVMDGNVSAENVYFPEDMLFTYNFGKYKTSNGNVTIPSAGKNLKELLMAAHVDIINPTTSAPSFSITASGSTTKEVGSSYDLPTATATFTAGKYSYGYVDAEGNKVSGTNTSTGVTATEIKITNDKTSDTKTVANANSATSTLSTENFSDSDLADLIVDEGNISYTFTATCSYPASTRTPTNNVGDTSNSETGVAYSPAAGGSFTGSTKKTSTATITGYRSSFYYVGTDHTTTLDSAFIRKGTNRNANTKDFNVSTVDGVKCLIIPQGTTRIVLAVPGTATLKEVKDIVGMGLDVKANFIPKTIAVEGVNGYTAKNYTVFECINANGLDATRYAITFN